jgi:hypothetical protein
MANAIYEIIICNFSAPETLYQAIEYCMRGMAKLQEIEVLAMALGVQRPSSLVVTASVRRGTVPLASETRALLVCGKARTWLHGDQRDSGVSGKQKKASAVKDVHGFEDEKEGTKATISKVRRAICTLQKEIPLAKGPKLTARVPTWK